MSFSHDFSRFINNPALYDVVLIAEIVPAQQESLDLTDESPLQHHAHWDILRSRSPFFQSLFEHTHAMQPTNHVTLPSTRIPISISFIRANGTPQISIATSPQALSTVIEYLYTGKYRPTSQYNPQIRGEIANLAACFELPKLLGTIESSNSRGTVRRALAATLLASGFGTDEFNPQVLMPSRNNSNTSSSDNIHKNSCMVEIEGRRYGISRIFFAASSEYFYAMFANGFHESTSNLIPIENVQRRDFEEIEHFVYHDHDSSYDRLKRLSMNKLKRLFGLAIYFQMESSLMVAIETVVHNCRLSHDSFVDWWTIGREYPQSDVQRICREYFQGNFGEIALEGSADANGWRLFYDVPKELLKEALQDGRIAASTDVMVEALVGWVKYQHEARGVFVNLLELLPPNTMFNAANKEHILHSRQLSDLRMLLRL